MRATPRTFAPRTPGTLDLEISDPLLILNEVARRYETAERVVMEYVDNALDDAETLWRENNGAYPYPIRVEVTIDRQQGAVAIRDNCRGMTRDTLERVVRNVGESQKRGQTWVNGRFGFGVHAFRAVAESIHFQTRHAHGSHYELALQRDQHRGIKEARRLDEPFPSDSGTGCLVTVRGFDADWFPALTAESLRAEIETHFERLLARPNLIITAGETGDPPLACRPFAFGGIEGVALQRELALSHKGADHVVEIALKVAAEPIMPHRASFFARSRRIGPVADTRSFMRKSLYKTRVWGHPHLIGHIEVGEIVQPVINRDDFVRAQSRTVLYEALLPIEAEIKQLLASANQQQRQQTLGNLQKVVQEAAREVSGARDFEVSFSANPGGGRYAEGEDGGLIISTAHPDFLERARFTRQGELRPGDRLNMYLATLLALAMTLPGRKLSLASSQDPEQLLRAQAELALQMESRLRG